MLHTFRVNISQCSIGFLDTSNGICTCDPKVKKENVGYQMSHSSYHYLLGCQESAMK